MTQEKGHNKDFVNSTISALRRDTIGQCCWHVSSGDAVFPTFILSLGERVQRTHLLRNTFVSEEYREFYGAIEIFVLSSWRLRTPENVYTSDADDETTAVSLLERLIGQIVMHCDILLPSLDMHLGFSGDFDLFVFCNQTSCGSRGNWQFWKGGTGFCVTNPQHLVVLNDVAP